MKKSLTVLLMSAVLGLVFLPSARACWMGPYGWEPGYYNQRGSDQEADRRLEQSRNEFMQESKDLRRQLSEKKQAYYDLMGQKKPDKVQAAKLWNEIFDLQEQLKMMAAEKGFSPDQVRPQYGGYGPGYFGGPGCGCGGWGGYGPRGWYGPRGGYGPGYSW